MNSSTTSTVHIINEERFRFAPQTPVRAAASNNDGYVSGSSAFVEEHYNERSKLFILDRATNISKNTAL
jgi:hypothetical protein